MHCKVTEESSHLTAGKNEFQNVEAPSGPHCKRMFRAGIKAAHERPRNPCPLGLADSISQVPVPCLPPPTRAYQSSTSFSCIWYWSSGNVNSPRPLLLASLDKGKGRSGMRAAIRGLARGGKAGGEENVESLGPREFGGLMCSRKS